MCNEQTKNSLKDDEGSKVFKKKNWRLTFSLLINWLNVSSLLLNIFINSSYDHLSV